MFQIFHREKSRIELFASIAFLSIFCVGIVFGPSAGPRGYTLAVLLSIALAICMSRVLPMLTKLGDSKTYRKPNDFQYGLVVLLWTATFIGLLLSLWLSALGT
jgi:hypothetical protein